jgi:ribonucleoside-diphosphate reductase alpha chain
MFILGFVKSAIVSGMFPDLKSSRILSIAPTGSISNLLGVSGGVEPYYNLGYWREVRLEAEAEKVFVWEQTPKMLADLLKIADVNELPDWARVTSQNVPIQDRLKVQATIQKYVDTAISSTFNLPNSATIDDIIYIYKQAWKLGLKGATVFRDNCAKIGVLSGIEGWQNDANPALPPVVQVEERWVGPYGVKQYINTLLVDKNGKIHSEKQYIEKALDISLYEQAPSLCESDKCLI